MNKTELVLGMGSSYQSTSQIEEELKDFWNNLTGQKQVESGKNSQPEPKNSNQKDNWLAKGLVIFLILVLLGIIYYWVRKKRK